MASDVWLFERVYSVIFDFRGGKMSMTYPCKGFRLSPEDLKKLKELGEYYDKNHTEIIRKLIRDEYKKCCCEDKK